MDSAFSSLSIEQFLCSICLDVFTEPVSTPCGHNYCRECIKKYWSYSNVIQCPLCEEMFHGTPDLQVNREFRDMLEVFKRTFLPCDDSSLAGPGDVPCDLCHERKCKALKSCLVCLASYCNVHLEPHRTVEAFKWHNLINPVLTLRERICREHNKVAVMFCKDDQCCICSACLQDDHALHNTVSLDEEFQERKTQVKQMKSLVQNVLREKRSMADRVQESLLQGQQEAQNIQAEIIKACDEVVALVEAKKVKLVRLLKEKQKAAEQEAKELLGQLQPQIIENVQMTATLEELSKTEDDFSLLRGLPPVASSVNTKLHFSPRVQPLLNLETVRNVVATIKETVDGEMDNIIREVELVDKEETFEEAMPAPSEKVFNDQLENLQENYSVNVTLDPNTAHPSLIISADRKKVWDRGRKRKALDNPARFDFLHFVLGKEGFSSGWFYFEVALKGQNSWEVGVVRESINKKGFDLQLSPESGCWMLGSYWGRCQANANPPVILSCKNPEKVGVFVDYEGGLVSFYSVATRALMYSFTECAFTASIPRNRGLSKCRFNTGTPAKTRIFPLFRPSGDGIGPLQIVTV